MSRLAPFAVATLLSACWRDAEMPPMPPAAPAVDEPEHVATTPIDKTFDDELELDQRLDADETSPWREIAVMHHGRAHRLVVATSAGRYAISLLDDARPLDGFTVTELALRPLVPRHRAWVVVVYATIRDGVKTTRFVACQPGAGDNPECSRPVEVGTTDMHDAPGVRFVYPLTGGLVVEPLGGGTPRRYGF